VGLPTHPPAHPLDVPGHLNLTHAEGQQDAERLQVGTVHRMTDKVHDR
jgi:hypothetical protein